jgi:hypothetical protein
VNSRQLAQVGLGLIGVWALLIALQGFMTLAVVAGASLGPMLLSIAAPVALLLGLSYVLVFHNGQLVAAIAPDDAAAREHGAPDLPRILVVLLGVLLLVQAIPGATSALLGLFAASEFPTMPSRARPVRLFIGSGVQLAIALFLIMRPQRLLDYVRRPVATTDQ